MQRLGQLLPHQRRIGRTIAALQWPLISSLGVGAVLLGFWGFQRHFSALDEGRSFWSILYFDLQLFVLEFPSGLSSIPWQLQVARFLAPAVAGIAAVKALLILFRGELERFAIWRTRGHIVVCGVGAKGLLLVRSLKRQGHKVVAIERDAENESVDVCRDSGAHVVIGDAREREVLLRSGIRRAAHVISVCGPDGANAEIAVQARKLALERPGGLLSCRAHIVDPQLCALLTTEEIASSEPSSFQLDFFNVFEMGARRIIREHPPFAEVSAGSKAPHFVVVGLGRLGESLLVHAVRAWRAQLPAGSQKLRATIVDRQADAKVHTMLLRYPRLAEVCELVPCQMTVDSPAYYHGEFLFDSDGNCDVAIVYVSLDDDATGLAAALALRSRLTGYDVPILMRLSRSDGLATLLEHGPGGAAGFEHLHGFGLLDRTLDASLLVGGTHEVLARAMHDDYVRKQMEEGATIETNPSMVGWDELAEDLRKSNRAEARHIGPKLRAAGCAMAPLTDWDAESFQFTVGEIEDLAEMEHDRWLEERRSKGWAFGPERDSKNKKNPNMLPWGQLPDDAKGWNRAAVRGLPGLLAKAGLQIVPVAPRAPTLAPGDHPGD